MMCPYVLWEENVQIHSYLSRVEEIYMWIVKHIYIKTLSLFIFVVIQTSFLTITQTVSNKKRDYNRVHEGLWFKHKDNIEIIKIKF